MCMVILMASMLAADLTVADYAARDALLAAALSPTAIRFGDRKVFLGSLGLDSVQHHARILWALNHEGLIELARADLVAAMDPAMVAASEIGDGHQTAHFLVLPE